MTKDIISNQRRIASDLDVETQVENLKSLVNNPPQNSRVVEFSPELASFILENLNVGNRPKKNKKIAQYASDMQNNNWTLTGESVKFGRDGHLKDGQNRLAACVRSNSSFTTHAVFGIDPSTFAHMDSGAQRSNTDVFSIMGVPYPKETGTAVRFILAFKKERLTTQSLNMTNEEIKDFYLKEVDHTLLQFCVKTAKITNRTTSLLTSPLAALHYLWHKAGYSEEAKDFMSCLQSGTGSGPRAPARYLLESIMRIRVANRMKIDLAMHNALLLRAFTKHRLGRACTKSDMTIRDGDGFPPIA